MFVNITYPLLTPIIAVVMTFSVLFTFTDFQLIKVLTNGGPAGATELMATMSYNTAILGGRIGEGAAISTAMVPFLLAAIMVSWFGLQRRKWQAGRRAMSETARRRRRPPREADDSGGHELPVARCRSALVRVYMPLSLIVIVLLFPFYWMTMTAIKPKEHLLDLDTHNPFYTLDADLRAHPRPAVQDRLPAVAVEHDVHRGRRRPSCR